MVFRAPPTSSADRLKLTESLIAEGATDVTRWSQFENLSTQWDERAKLAGDLIGSDPVKVLDVGCGAMTLEQFLAEGSTYSPADVAARREGCFVVDLNKGEFPAGVYDYVSFLGVLEYIHDPAWPLRRAREAAPRLIVSYCADISGDVAYRRGMGWVNDYAKAAFEALLVSCGWAPVDCVGYKRSATNAQFIWKCVRSDEHETPAI